MDKHGCEATYPQLKDPGWECTGTDLVTVMTGPKGVAVVVPRSLLPRALAEPWASAYDEPKPFTGGEHFHLVVEPAKADDLLSVPLGDNDSGKTTLGGFLAGMIDLEEKRPYGNSGWEHELYDALVKAGKLDGRIDDDGYAEVDLHAASDLLRQAVEQIQAMFP